MADFVTLRLPNNPADAGHILAAMFKAWDSYGKPGNVGCFGTPEATRIYRELQKLASAGDEQ